MTKQEFIKALQNLAYYISQGHSTAKAIDFVIDDISRQTFDTKRDEKDKTIL